MKTKQVTITIKAPNDEVLGKAEKALAEINANAENGVLLAVLGEQQHKPLPKKALQSAISKFKKGI